MILKAIDYTISIPVPISLANQSDSDHIDTAHCLIQRIQSDN